MRPVGSKYLLEESLGRGATGTVWRARVREDAQVAGIAPGQAVAIKVLREELAADPDVVMRFLRERNVLLRLDHPNVVRVRDLVVEGELLALVMDLVEGPDLFRYLRGNGPFSPIAGALLMAQITDALAASHADGIVHRDLKPANVLLASMWADGVEQMHPMLTDFGIARLADSPGITRTHEFVGTPAYVAPESADGRPQTAAVDIYGAGIMLYELVTGQAPFQGDGPLAVLQAHLTQDPERPAGLPEPLWTVIERCLRKNPAQRPSATSLARALRVVAAGIGTNASPAAAEAAFAVGGLLLPDPKWAAEDTTAAAATQVLPAGNRDAMAATQVLSNAPAPDRTQVMPPMPTAPPAPAGPGAPGADTPHPWQTQLRAARDRNQRTEVFDPMDLGDPQVAPPPYRAMPGGGPGQPPRPAQQQRPGYNQRPPVAPPPYQSRPGQARQGQQPYPGQPQGYAQPAQPPAQPYAQPPARRPEAAPQRRPEPPAPQYREPREPQYREPEPRREREPRRRSPNRMYIPGLGCLKGCLMVLLILAVAALALWNFTPLPHYWDNVVGWWDSARTFVTSLTGK